MENCGNLVALSEFQKSICELALATNKPSYPYLQANFYPSYHGHNVCDGHFGQLKISIRKKLGEEDDRHTAFHAAIQLPHTSATFLPDSKKKETTKSKYYATNLKRDEAKLEEREAIIGVEAEKIVGEMEEKVDAIENSKSSKVENTNADQADTFLRENQEEEGKVVLKKRSCWLFDPCSSSPCISYPYSTDVGKMAPIRVSISYTEVAVSRPLPPNHPGDFPPWIPPEWTSGQISMQFVDPN